MLSCIISIENVASYVWLSGWKGSANRIAPDNWPCYSFVPSSERDWRVLSLD